MTGPPRSAEYQRHPDRGKTELLRRADLDTESAVPPDLPQAD